MPRSRAEAADASSRSHRVDPSCPCARRAGARAGSGAAPDRRPRRADPGRLPGQRIPDVPAHQRVGRAAARRHPGSRQRLPGRLYLRAGLRTALGRAHRLPAELRLRLLGVRHPATERPGPDRALRLPRRQPGSRPRHPVDRGRGGRHPERPELPTHLQLRLGAPAPARRDRRRDRGGLHALRPALRADRARHVRPGLPVPVGRGPPCEHERHDRRRPRSLVRADDHRGHRGVGPPAVRPAERRRLHRVAYRVRHDLPRESGRQRSGRARPHLRCAPAAVADRGAVRGGLRIRGRRQHGSHQHPRDRRRADRLRAPVRLPLHGLHEHPDGPGVAGGPP